MNKTQSGSSDNALQHAFQIIEGVTSVDIPHVLVVVLFVFVLRAKIAYLPIFVPAFLLSAYQEWSLHAEDGISTIKYSLSSILVCWFGTFACRLAKRRMMMHNLVRPLRLMVHELKLIQ